MPKTRSFFKLIISVVFSALSFSTLAQLDMELAKKKCAELGFKPKTEQYGKCVLQLSRSDEPKPTTAVPQSTPELQRRLPPCPGTYDQLTWTNCIGTFTFFKGGTYVGEYKYGKRNGQGTHTSPDGQKYVGEWSNDSLHGHGIEYRTDGTTLRSGVWEYGEFIEGR